MFPDTSQDTRRFTPLRPKEGMAPMKVWIVVSMVFVSALVWHAPALAGGPGTAEVASRLRSPRFAFEPARSPDGEAVPTDLPEGASGIRGTKPSRHRPSSGPTKADATVGGGSQPPCERRSTTALPACKVKKPCLAAIEDCLAYALDIPLAMLSPITCPIVSAIRDAVDPVDDRTPPRSREKR